MGFRDVRVFEVQEVLRLWLWSEGLRTVERLVGIDRKTVRRYVTVALELGGRPRGERRISSPTTSSRSG